MKKIQNPHDLTANKTEKELHESKITEMVKQDLSRSKQPFSLRYAMANAMGNAIQYTLHGILGIGAAAGIGILIAGHGEHWALWVLGGVSGAVGGAALEVMKHKGQSELWYGVFYLKQVRAGLLLAAIGAASLSTLAVLPAAAHLPKATAAAPPPPQLKQLDTTYFNAEFERIHQAQEFQRKQTRGIKDAKAEIAKLEEDLRTLKQKREETIKSIEKENAQALSEHQKAIETQTQALDEQGVWSMWFSVALEGLLLASSLGTWFYRYKCLTERPQLIDENDTVLIHENETKQNETKQNNETNNENELHALRNALRKIEEQQRLLLENQKISPKPIIGFSQQNHFQNDNVIQQPPPKENDDKPILKAKEKHCEHCGNDFVYKTTWQKFCSEDCRIAAYELRTGKKFRK